MTLIALEEAGTRLTQLIEDAQGGEEVVITRDNAPIAKLIPVGPPRRQAGTAKGVILYMADDFDAPLDDFKVGLSLHSRFCCYC